MSETAIKHKVGPYGVPGVDKTSDNPKVFDTALNSFDDTRLLDAILSEFKIDAEGFMSQRRFERYMEPMHLYRYLLRRIKGPKKRPRVGYFRYSHGEVGTKTKCDHSTITCSCKTAEDLIQTDKIYRAKYEAILSKLPRYMFTLKKLY